MRIWRVSENTLEGETERNPCWIIKLLYLRQLVVNSHLFAYNTKGAFNIIMQQCQFTRHARTVRGDGRRLDICPPIHNPLVDGSRDAVLCAILHFFIIGHPFGVAVSERVEIVTAETFVHVREGNLS